MQQHPVDHDLSPPNASTDLIQNLNRPASDKNNLSLNVNKNDTLTENENNNNNGNSIEKTSLPPKQSEKENDINNNNKNNIIDILNNYCILSKTNNSELPTLAPRPPPLPIEVIKSISEEDIKNFNKLFDANQLPLPNVTSLSQIDHNQIEALTQFYLAAITANRNKTNGQSSDNQANTVTAEMIKREILNHKVRADNRERKKRWREQNEERNKDNDLRCRVNKRALKLFGKEQSDVKQLWIENEFNRRQYKRKEKERRKYAVNNVVSANHSKSNGNTTSTSNSSPSSSSSSPHSFASHLPILQDAYLSMVLNNLETMSPASAFKFVEGMRLMESTIKNGTENEQSLSHQVADFLQQLQQYQPTEQDISEKLGKSDLQLTEPTSNKDHDPSTQVNSPIAEPILSYLSSSVSSPSLSSVSSSLSPSPPETINTSIEHTKANNDNIYNPVSSTSISNQHSNASLSTLLISTLQQAAVIDSNMEQENLLSSISPTVADDMNNTIPQHPNQLYPMEQIMTLMKLNTQWKLM